MTARPSSPIRRELREETGYAARSWKRLGVVQPNPAIQANRCSTYLARGCRPVGDLLPDEGEDLAVELVPLRASRTSSGAAASRTLS